MLLAVSFVRRTLSLSSVARSLYTRKTAWPSPSSSTLRAGFNCRSCWHQTKQAGQISLPACFVELVRRTSRDHLSLAVNQYAREKFCRPSVIHCMSVARFFPRKQARFSFYRMNSAESILNRQDSIVCGVNAE